MSNISPRSQLLNNITKGKIGQRIAELDYLANGFSVQRTGIGSDFVAVKKLGDCNVLYTEFVEVKTGRAKPSRSQITTMRKMKKFGKKYTIYRVTDAFLRTYLDSIQHSLGGIKI